MSISSKLDQFHFQARKNRWLRYFAVFNRIALAAGFIPSGLQKVLGERFTVLPVNHPMGHYLDAFYQTGYFYTFVGVMQVTAAILLLIPRTVTIGAIIYFPIILNICILSFAVRFEGSIITSPLMVLATLYLLCWDYHKFKFIFPFNNSATKNLLPKKEEISNRLPVGFFTAVATVVLLVVLNARYGYNVLPRNTMSDCKSQCDDNANPNLCFEFCDCIHNEGKSLNACLEEFKNNRIKKIN